VGLEAKPRCLERDRPATGKGIEYRRKCPIDVLQHLRAGLCIDLRALMQFLLHQLTHNVEKTLSFGILGLLGRELVGMRRWVVYDGSE